MRNTKKKNEINVINVFIKCESVMVKMYVTRLGPPRINVDAFQDDALCFFFVLSFHFI